MTKCARCSNSPPSPRPTCRSDQLGDRVHCLETCVYRGRRGSGVCGVPHGATPTAGPRSGGVGAPAPGGRSPCQGGPSVPARTRGARVRYPRGTVPGAPGTTTAGVGSPGGTPRPGCAVHARFMARPAHQRCRSCVSNNGDHVGNRLRSHRVVSRSRRSDSTRRKNLQSLCRSCQRAHRRGGRSNVHDRRPV